MASLSPRTSFKTRHYTSLAKDSWHPLRGRQRVKALFSAKASIKLAATRKSAAIGTKTKYLISQYFVQLNNPLKLVPPFKLPKLSAANYFYIIK
jgi:hypothetical protein